MTTDTIRIAVTASALGDDPRQSPRAARALGFRGLQFDASSSAIDLIALSMSGRREFLRLLATQEQQLVGLRFDLGPKGFAPGADVDRALDRLDRVMEAAAAMSAPLVCLEMGPMPAPARVAKPKPRITPDQAGLIFLPGGASAAEMQNEPPPPLPPPPDPAFLSQLDGALSDLGRRADRYSVIVAMRSDLASFAAVERAMLAAACPWFGLDLDPAAILRDEWDADETFSRFGPLIRHVRGRDAVAGADRRTRPAIIGAGSTEWESLLADLDALSYRGWITIDPVDLADRPAAAEAGRKRLSRLIRQGE